MQRRVHTYRDYIDLDRLRDRITALNAAGLMDKAIAARLNAEGSVAARGCAFAGGNVWLLRQRFGIATVKINGVSANPPRWPDEDYSIRGAAVVLGVREQTVFKYLARGDLSGRQSAKGQPWQITPTPEMIEALHARAQRNKRSRRETS
ncbi:hypothetical protein [Methylobacterium brachiatum]|uniref:hypothetical protein n=1 Tax=Methylobacterium brachiatum TaxID=269660 RepID=UPI000EFB8A0B|nr:hypothetical protein [Methylobacterium brachiatum]AYO86521.1 hypothetical protein EBB05_29615 [Methylobacterium brachiatum]